MCKSIALLFDQQLKYLVTIWFTGTKKTSKKQNQKKNITSTTYDSDVNINKTVQNIDSMQIYWVNIWKCECQIKYVY